MRWALLALGLLACGGGDDTVELQDTGPTEVEQAFPLPPDIDKLDWVQIFTDAVSVMVNVNAQAPFLAHRMSMETRAVSTFVNSPRNDSPRCIEPDEASDSLF